MAATVSLDDHASNAACLPLLQFGLEKVVDETSRILPDLAKESFLSAQEVSFELKVHYGRDCTHSEHRLNLFPPGCES